MRRAPVLAALLLPAVLLGSCGDGDHAAERARAVVPLRLDRVHVGDDERGGEVFLPRGVARPPVVLFIHGLFATSPEMYGGWIRHLVDEGNAVIYPTYQHTFTPPAAFLANTIAAVRAALSRVPVQRRTLVAAGHSAGGALAADYAAVAPSLGLPAPRAVYSVYPGRGLEGIPFRIPEADEARIAPATRIEALGGAADRIVGTAVARDIVADATTVPSTHRTFHLVTDHRVDTHLAPQRATPAARRAFWAPLDRLIRRARRS